MLFTGETSFSDSRSIRVLPTSTTVCPQLEELNHVVKEKLCYERVDVNDYSSPDPKKKYDYIQGICKGLTAPAVMYTHSLGSNLGKYYIFVKNSK